ncbi:MAG: FHA domain-containing protein [Synechococcales cyanobacterium CRU_2_2]|nr:FHA domain-containing protein [Synechococcales cyanobacterium CRU_2_2]
MFYFLDFDGDRLDLRGSFVELGRAQPLVDALKDRSVSRSHARLTKEDDRGWRIENISKNTLLINGKEAGGLLKSGDILTLGGIKAKYSLDAEATFPSGAVACNSKKDCTLALQVNQIERKFAEICDRMDRNEALDARFRSALERVAIELQTSTRRSNNQIRRLMCAAFGVIALSIFCTIAIGAVRNTEHGKNFAQALLEQILRTDGIFQLALGSASAAFPLMLQKDQEESPAAIVQSPFDLSDFDVDDWTTGTKKATESVA